MTIQEVSGSGTFSTSVIVVGAGPVGTVLALELARHGVPCTVVERSISASRHPKMDYVNGRSMELLRRYGIADKIRTHGIPTELTSDFLWSRHFAEDPVAIWHYDSPATVARRYAGVNDGSAPDEPYQRVQGSLLEDVLRNHVRNHELIDLREGWTFTDLQQGIDRVTVTVVEPGTRTRRYLHARYVVACDGAKSAVRQCLDIPVDVAGPTVQNSSVYFRSSDPVLRRHGRAFVTIAARGMTLVSRDERDTWTGSFPLPEGEPVVVDPVGTMQERLGVEFEVDEVLSVAQWTGQLGLATAYRLGSVFLAGDSAHQFYPTGGHGANTGLADAVDLGWKLAACVQGWGGPRLLDSYEAERRPVALFNREMCAKLLEVWRRFSRLATGGTSREQLAGFLEQETHHIDNAGVHFGYRYTGSPVICHEDGTPPAWHWSRITPTTVPGGRAPSLRLSDGSRLFDLLGVGFTLVDFTRDGGSENLVKEASRRNIPVKHLRIDERNARTVWERDLVLVRPDQHVAWRGNAAPTDWEAVLDRISGR